jgi:hypothetical protein
MAGNLRQVAAHDALKPDPSGRLTFDLGTIVPFAFLDGVIPALDSIRPHEAVASGPAPGPARIRGGHDSSTRQWRGMDCMTVSASRNCRARGHRGDVRRAIQVSLSSPAQPDFR